MNHREVYREACVHLFGEQVTQRGTFYQNARLALFDQLTTEYPRVWRAVRLEQNVTKHGSQAAGSPNFVDLTSNPMVCLIATFSQLAQC